MNEFTADVCRLPVSLDRLSRRDNVECFAAIVQSAREVYEDAVQHKETLKL
ncbi:MAG TPA: hypothetical protein VJV22_12470 [Acidobacteriaceae bacterium]|nr:hypothetical protein [Acidobacteriaceae bacterium]